MIYLCLFELDRGFVFRWWTANNLKELNWTEWVNAMEICYERSFNCSTKTYEPWKSRPYLDIRSMLYLPIGFSTIASAGETGLVDTLTYQEFFSLRRTTKCKFVSCMLRRKFPTFLNTPPPPQEKLLKAHCMNYANEISVYS